MVFNLIIFWIQLFGILGFLPPIMDGIQSCKSFTFPNFQVWIMVVINPILSISLIFNPIEPNIMNLISEKNQHQNWKATKRLFFIVLKSIIPSVVCFFVYSFTLTSFIPEISWSVGKLK
jgi:hypothetical protein